MMQHIFSEIPGWAIFIPLYKQMVEQAEDGAHFIEVGSWLGKSASYMAVEIINSGKDIQFDCVDPWDDGGPDLRHKAAKFPEPLFDMFTKNIAPVAHIIKAVRKPSVSAARGYKKGTLDFVMLDGSHVYEDVKADTKAWLPKLKVGGTLAFDDWNWNGPRTAAQEMLPKDKIVVHDTGHVPKGTSKGTVKYATYVVE